MDPNQIQQGGVSPQQETQDPQVAIVDQTQDQSQIQQQNNQPITDQQKEELLNMIDQIKAKLGSLSATRFASGNKAEVLRRSLLKQVFEKLQSAGVDLSDRQSVADFMGRLRQDNPELADLFEQAMDSLLGGATGGGFSEPQNSNELMDLGIPPQNNMNNINPNETLSQEVQGPVSQAG
jgi:hypothetical protein